MKKSLIVYYSLSGLTKKVVDVLKNFTDADIYEIELEKPYSKTDYGPAIKNEIDLSNYDKIFIGGPAWYFTYAPPIHSFIKKYNLGDKVIYPFGTATSNFGNYFERFSKECKAKEIKNPLEVLKSTFKNGLEDAVKSWLDKEYN